MEIDGREVMSVKAYAEKKGQAERRRMTSARTGKFDFLAGLDELRKEVLGV